MGNWSVQMIKFLWRTDVHLSDRGPSTRLDDWKETLLEKLSQVGDLAKEHDCQFVLDGGDFFHFKSPVKTSHSLIKQVVDVHSAYPCPVFSCVGNHDCVYGDYEFLHQQPLGVLFTTNIFRRLYNEHDLTLDVDGVSVRVVGIPYHGRFYDLDLLRSVKKGDEDFLMMVSHLYASEKGGSMYGNEDIVSYDFLRDECEADVFFFGHWHKDQGITEVEPGRFVVNIGSLSRGALSSDHVDRTPSVALVTLTDKIEIQKLPLKVRPSSEIFDLHRRERLEKLEALQEAFLEEVRDSNFLQGDLSENSVEELIECSGFSEQVKEQAILFWEQSS